MKDYMWTTFTVALILGLVLALLCNPPQAEADVEALTLTDLFPKREVVKHSTMKPFNKKDLYLIYQMYFDKDLIALRIQIEEWDRIHELD